MPGPIAAAVIGARIGRLHATALARLPDAAPRWVCDTDRALAERVAGECGARATTSLDEVLADAAVDLVTIAVPHHLHFDFARRALAAGKHVAVEKPLCNTLDEVDRLIALRGAAGPRIGVILQNRFPEAARRFLACVRGGGLGELRLAAISVKWFRAAGYYEAVPWRARWSTAGGGVLTMNGIHYLDLVQAAVGLPRSVRARMATLGHDIEVEDIAVATGVFADGALFSLTATTACFPEEPAYVQIVGARGSACLAESRGQIAFAATTEDDGAGRVPLLQSFAALDDAAPQDATVPIQLSDEGHRDFFAAFLASLRSGAPFELDEREARKSAQILDAIYRSARTNAEVEIG